MTDRSPIDIVRQTLDPNRLLTAALLLAVLLAACGSYPPVELKPRTSSAQVPTNPDDPAIWVNSHNPERSLVLGTNKTSAPDGALVVFGLDGQIVQTISNLERPNNVDVEYGFLLGDRAVDIAVVTEREQHRLRVFEIAPDGSGLSDISATDELVVFRGEQGERGEPMGIGLYRNPVDGAIYAIVSRKAGPSSGYLWQYRLEHNGEGKVRAIKVRELGNFYGGDQIEAVAVDDELGAIYYADESYGIHKWSADPFAEDAKGELAVFGLDGFRGDREGIAVIATGPREGYILCTDQVEGNSSIMVYDRAGLDEDPNHHRQIKRIRVATDETDGLEVTGEPLPGFPHGLVVVMDNAGRNYLLFRWDDFALTEPPELELPGH